MVPQISEHKPRGIIQNINVTTGIFQIVPQGCVPKSPVRLSLNIELPYHQTNSTMSNTPLTSTGL